MEQNFKLRLLSYSVIAYMLLAFAWWSVLLFIKNTDAFEAKRDLQEIMMAVEGKVDSKETYYESEAYKQLKSEYKTQEWMIAGEAFFFVFSLVIGIWLINRGYNKEMMAARQRRNFLLSITHELKSPIASVRLVLETVMKRTLSKEQTNKLHGMALKETDRLHALVNDLLLSARLEATYNFNLETINLKELIEDLASKIQMKYNDLEFSFQTTEHQALFAGDKTGLTSVILNLLENAVKYSGGHKYVAIGLEGNKKNWIIKIADQGIGIEDHEKKLIFQKFYRIGSEDTRKTKGTGLGLYIVYRMVLAHKGSIEVLDNEPKGTVFVIRLPRDQSLGQESVKKAQFTSSVEA